jgi:predicted lipoprotein with Yx(FWY)xxD motif
MMRLIATGAAAGALLVAGCGGDDDDDSGGAAATATAPATTSASEASAPAAKGTTVQLSGSDFGEVLFGGNDQAIYLFDKEQGSKSECYGECAAAWPPVLTEGQPQAGKGLEATLLGTIKRDDGKTQVTYGGHPLYYYAHEGPGQVLCQNVDEFGGLWLVVKADGDPVRGA